jgi:hypothetical protein
MRTFVALYRGRTVGSAQLVAVSADTELVGAVASRLLHAPCAPSQTTDPVLAELEQGRRKALAAVAGDNGE